MNVLINDINHLQDLRKSLNIDDDKLLSLEARISGSYSNLKFTSPGLPKEKMSEILNSNSNSRTFASNIELVKNNGERENSFNNHLTFAFGGKEEPIPKSEESCKTANGK